MESAVLLCLNGHIQSTQYPGFHQKPQKVTLLIKEYKIKAMSYIPVYLTWLDSELRTLESELTQTGDVSKLNVAWFLDRWSTCYTVAVSLTCKCGLTV